ncbi:aspartate--tRNA ligase [Bacteroidetes/Chlorobi group bacterium ChocPot_Mid]|nr:MAG: aspartate--tRNA ligase [Bacteroidetes/Chlorobi group bacterium ChocPot_Mid]
MIFPKRTCTCGELRKENENIEVVLNGWVSGVRDLGGLIFIDLRDRYGLTQIVIEPENRPDLAERAKELKSEFVIWAKGKVRLRSNPNPNIPTGLIEVLLEDYGVLNKSQLPPFEIDDSIELQEETRLKYRFLDLRRPSLQKNLILRNELYQIMHKYYYENNFIEIETPFFMKSTPEGARDFLVPSRIHKGKFYALPQSPQLYKQILMISGFDRYVQIAKCFRDEDLRADRQPEFTQIDVEMSFIDEEDIIKMTEGFFKLLWKETLGIDIQTPFQRMSYKDAMEKYGSDKPDLRFGWELKDISDLVNNCEFKVFTDAVNNGGTVAVLNVKGCAETYSRKKIDELTEFAKKYGAKGLAWMKLADGQVNSPIAKFFKKEELDAVIERTEAKDGDLLLFGSDKWTTCFTVLGALRLEIARQTGLLESVRDKFAFLWVVDFPLFEYDEESKRYVAMHHPFTSPKFEDMQFIDDNPGKVRARAYDIVVNGAEVGGGSIRIHDTDVQQKMFKLLGLTQEEANSKFGFLLDALKYGAPPHGGIALGLDRLVMTLAGTENIRNVIAFPKTTSGLSLMDGSPSTVDEEQLKELGIKIINN